MDVGSKVILIRKGCPDGALLLNANGQIKVIIGVIVG
jgi:hypothetical protein